MVFSACVGDDSDGVFFMVEDQLLEKMMISPMPILLHNSFWHPFLAFFAKCTGIQVSEYCCQRFANLAQQLVFFRNAMNDQSRSA